MTFFSLNVLRELTIGNIIFAIVSFLQNRFMWKYIKTIVIKIRWLFIRGKLFDKPRVKLKLSLYSSL